MTTEITPFAELASLARDSGIWQDDSALKLYLHCLIEANHSPFFWHGTTVQSGQMAMVERHTAQSLVWSRSKLNRKTQLLQEIGLIEILSVSHHGTLLRINHWPQDKAITNPNAPGATERGNGLTIEPTWSHFEAKEGSVAASVWPHDVAKGKTNGLTIEPTWPHGEAKTGQFGHTMMPTSPYKKSIYSSTSSTPSTEPEGFTDIWVAYPVQRRTQRKEAARLVSQALQDGATISTMLSALEAEKQSESWQKENGRYIPGIVKWLEKETWRSFVQHTEPKEDPEQWMSLVKLRTPAIQKFYIDLQEKGLSAKYIKNIHGCLHKALDIAVRIDYIQKNPTSACIIPRVIQKEMHPLDAPEQVQLLQSLKGNKYEALIITALFTGMRAGELLGLTWDNVDFEHGVIHVVKQLTQSRGEGHPFSFGTLKNGKTRSLNPAPYVLETLKAHKEHQEHLKKVAGDLWNEGKFPNLVFTHDDGSHLSQPTIWKAFQKALEEAGLEHHRLHDCRHTFAVNSIRAGDDIKTIQENMGHYSAAFTLDRYGHVTETMRQESANRMQAFIQGMAEKEGEKT